MVNQSQDKLLIIKKENLNCKRMWAVPLRKQLKEAGGERAGQEFLLYKSRGMKDPPLQDPLQLLVPKP